MRYLIGVLILFCIFQFSIAEPIINVAVAKELKQKKENTNQLLQRIDFGNSYIIGQTLKSGAIYLLKRKKSDIKSMLKGRENYRKEILENFYIKDMKVKE